MGQESPSAPMDQSLQGALLRYVDTLKAIPSLKITTKTGSGQFYTVEWNRLSGNYCLDTTSSGPEMEPAIVMESIILEVDGNLGFMDAYTSYFFITRSSGEADRSRQSIPRQTELHGPLRAAVLEPLYLLCHDEIRRAKCSWDHMLHPGDLFDSAWLKGRMAALIEVDARYEKGARALSVPASLMLNDGNGNLVNSESKTWEVVFGPVPEADGAVLPVRAYRCLWWDNLEPNAIFGARNLLDLDAIGRIDYLYRKVAIGDGRTAAVIAGTKCTNMRRGQYESEASARAQACTVLECDTTIDYASDRVAAAKSIVDLKSQRHIDPE